MSYRSQRQRRDRQIRREVREIALTTSHSAWKDFCIAINSKPLRERVRYAWHTLRGTLQFETA